MPSIEFVESPPSELTQKMEEGLKEYETQHGIDVNFKRFSFMSKKEQEVIGILNAFHSYNCIHIEDFWIKATHRGKGYGKKLVKALENHFAGKGFDNINTVSCAFQAPEFYKKCGFQEEFVRVNQKNPKLTMTFFVKYFDDSENDLNQVPT